MNNPCNLLDVLPINVWCCLQVEEELTSDFADQIQWRCQLIIINTGKQYEQNGENLINLDKEYWESCTIWKFADFCKVKHPYEYANQGVDDVIASQFSLPFVPKIDKYPTFLLLIPI